MTTNRDRLDALLADVPVPAGRRRGQPRAQGAVRFNAGDTFRSGQPCAVVTQQVTAIRKAMVKGNRHTAILGQLEQLLRLGTFGHYGVPEALAELKAEFVMAVDDTRDDEEAIGEWDRALQGAADQVKPGRTDPDLLCDCEHRQLRLLAERPELFSERGGVNERKVLRYLLLRAGYGHSRLVRESQRQIAWAVDLHRPSVDRALKRLEALGWLEAQHDFTVKRGESYRLSPLLTTVPTREDQSITTMPIENEGSLVTVPSSASSSGPRPSPAGSQVGIGMSAHVHRLFGPKGFPAGMAETFSALPERRTPVARGHLIFARKGSVRSTALANPWRASTRRIPRPAAGDGATAKEIAARIGRSRATVARDLRAMARHRLVFKDDQGRWWRYRFAPDAVADELGIPHTAELKAARFLEERRAMFDQLADHGVFVRAEAEGRTSFFDLKGELVWADPRPDAAATTSEEKPAQGSASSQDRSPSDDD